MQRFLIVAVACALGLGAALAFAFLADMARPCTGERLTCSITHAVGLVYSCVFSAVALIAFSIAAFWKSGLQSLRVAALVPLVSFLLLMAYIKWSEFSVREFHDIRERDIQELLQIILPIVLTLIVPWFVLHRFAARAVPEKNAHG